MTTKAMIQGIAEQGTGLPANQGTLDAYIKGTNLEGRATVDPTLAGKDELGITKGQTGRVRISPDAFVSEGVLKQVVYHEGIHVDQIAKNNFYAFAGAAQFVNEIEAYRKELAYALRLPSTDMASEAFRAKATYNLADYVELLSLARGGGAYYEQVTTWPYSYALQPEDKCIACSLK